MALSHKLALLCVCLFLLTSVPGCSGCRESWFKRSQRLKNIDEEEEKKKKKQEETKPNVEIRTATTVPGAGDTPGLTLAKPGHWMTVVHEIEANNFDINADLITAVTSSRGAIYPIENTPFQIKGSRPAPLPKGQQKLFETRYYIPKATQGTTIFLSRELRAARGGGLVGPIDSAPARLMYGYQYHFVVLANEPDRYAYLKVLPSFAAPTDNLEIEEDRLRYYRVLLPQVERIAPVPTESLCWSTIAYLLWDDLDPSTFTEQQQLALVDWLHWGGQLIISGPNTLEKLTGSFLGPYLPARPGEAIQIDEAAAEELNQNWSVPSERPGEKRSLEIPPGRPMLGVRLARHEQAQVLPGTDGLVCERSIGQGRIVVTAFSLTDPVLLRWKSFDGFVNACLLRRPARRFLEEESLVPTTYWAGPARPPMTDSRLITGLRYFTRDVGNVMPGMGSDDQLPRLREDADPRRRRPDRERPSWVANPRALGGANEFLRGYALPGAFGVAAWNDRSGAANVARRTLRDAAGISIPRGEFVLQVLAIYLLVLAPLNWGFFRLMGRVEWAWVAAPVIAIIGAFAVIRYAQLDIGFARSLTEVAVAEIQPAYPRAHVTRYSALYTSLSTGYEIAFDDTDSLIQPFASGTQDQRRSNDPTLDATLRLDRDLRLSGFLVGSNKTGIIHSEQYCDLGGTFQFVAGSSGDFQLSNGTDWALHDVGVLRRTLGDELQVAWVGELPANSQQSLTFTPSEVAYLSQWDASSATISLDRQVAELLERYDLDGDGKLIRSELSDDPEQLRDFLRSDIDSNGELDYREFVRWTRRSREGEISLGQLVRLASEYLMLRPGETRLIGWSERAMPGRTIRPGAAQITVRTMFLAHLEAGKRPDPQRDQNSYADIERTDQQPTVNEQDLLRLGPDGAALAPVSDPTTIQLSGELAR